MSICTDLFDVILCILQYEKREIKQTVYLQILISKNAVEINQIICMLQSYRYFIMKIFVLLKSYVFPLRKSKFSPDRKTNKWIITISYKILFTFSYKLLKGKSFHYYMNERIELINTLFRQTNYFVLIKIN